MTSASQPPKSISKSQPTRASEHHTVSQPLDFLLWLLLLMLLCWFWFGRARRQVRGCLQRVAIQQTVNDNE